MSLETLTEPYTSSGCGRCFLFIGRRMLEILSERSELRSSYIQHFLSAINFREVVFFHNFFVLSTCRKCWISVRFAPLLRRFWFFCSVQRAPTTALVDAASIKLAANDGVAKTNILYAAAAHEYHRVLLQIMPFTRDIDRKS